MSADATISTSTGEHPLDPYKTESREALPLSRKVEDLVDFISDVKFGMLTTHQSEGEYLASRCMALASKVGDQPQLSRIYNEIPKTFERV